MSELMPIGTRVKLSDSGLSGARDWYFQQKGGRFANVAREGYESKKAQRGTVTGHLLPHKGNMSKGYTVEWDGGSLSHCIYYLVSKT